MSEHVKITGIPATPASDGSVPLRRELRDLQKNHADQFNLLLLGLRALQATDETNTTSYYSIAGIHGLPYKAWDGVESDTDWAASGGFGGYCVHSSVLFTTWHRPYVALYEQCLYAAVQDVAKQFPSSVRARYVEAAQTFRWPYFDWGLRTSRGESAFPTALSSPTISVVDVDGATKTIANPLYNYTFHSANGGEDELGTDWSQYPTTVRRPSRDGRSQDAKIGPILANESASLRSNLSTLLLSYTAFDAFTSNQWDESTNRNAYGSLEDVHNEIHDKIGGGGHFSTLESSAFDPCFMLHHANVDRLWHIWQDLNPTAFIEPQPSPTTTFWAAAGEQQTADTPLLPFRDATGTDFWTSTRVRNAPATFGYAYPETQRWQYANDDAYAAALKSAVAALYGGNVFASFQPRTLAVTGAEDQTEGSNNTAELKKRDEPKAEADTTRGITPNGANQSTTTTHASKGIMSRIAKLGFGKTETEGSHDVAVPRDTPAPAPPAPAPKDPAPAAIPAVFARLAPQNTYTDWTVNVRVQKHGLGQSFRVVVFLGPVPADTASWPLAPSRVGRVSVLGRSPLTRCAKCRDDSAAGLMVSGTVALTPALLQDMVDDVPGVPQTLDPADVVPYLTANLSWRVTLFAGGDEVQAADVPGLKVSVVSRPVTIGHDGIPQHAQDVVVHPEVTAGKTGGLNAGEEQ